MLAGVGGVGALGLGVAGLRRAWSHADRARPWFISAGWLLAALGLAAWCAGPWRADKAIALGVLGFSCLGGAAAAAGFVKVDMFSRILDKYLGVCCWVKW